MSASIRSLALAMVIAAAAAPGCAGRMLNSDAAPHGNLHAELARAATPQDPLVSPPPPTVVMIERDGVRAVDPEAGKQIWYYPRGVVGHPVGSAAAVYLPLRGNRVAKLDRATGTLRWIAQLPGEALVGLAVAEPTLLATVVDGSDKARSTVVALDTATAANTWERRSRGRIGAPRAMGALFIVPLAGRDPTERDAVVALQPSSGRELARVDLGAHASDLPMDRLGAGRDGTLFAGGGNRFVNLNASTGGSAPTPQRVDTGYGVLFPDRGGMDQGFDDSTRLRLDLRFAHNGEAPRQGVLLSRRAVLSMRMAPDGRPLRARWLHTDPREFVAMDVGEHRVTLVREDGAIVELDAVHGDVVHVWAGKQPAQGALLLGLHDLPRTDVSEHASARTLHKQLVRLVADDDARLLPAQVLALELLWRSDDIRSRRTVGAVARRTYGPWHTDAGEQLVQQARRIRARSWGTADAQALATRLDHLKMRPGTLAQRSQSGAGLAHQTIDSGTRAMVRPIVVHLMHPATPVEDLPKLVDALGILGGPIATRGLLTFVRSYHADVEFVIETGAVHGAVDHLARVVANREALAAQAESTLDHAMRDPFTEPSLRAHIERVLQATGHAGAGASATP